LTLDQIRRGDGIITRNGSMGIATSEPFKLTSHFDIDVVRVDFTTHEMPIQLSAISEVWRDGRRIDNQEGFEQLALFALEETN